MNANETNAENVTRLRRMLRVVVAFWRRPISAEPLAMCRIVTALTVLIGSLLGIAPNLHWYWSPEGVYPSEVADQYLKNSGHISLLRSPENIPLVSAFIPQAVVDAWRDVTDNMTAVIGLFSVWMLALVFVAVGLYTRTSTIVAWLLALSFHQRMIYVLNGGDDVALQLMFYLMLAPAGAVWSIDSLRRRWKTERVQSAVQHRNIALAPVTIAPWSVRLMQIQLCCIYLVTGFSKMNVAETNDYLTGEAVYWALNDICLARWSYAQLPVPMWICRLLSWGTLVFEFGFIPFVMFRRLRPWLLWGGVAFHVGILLTMEVGWFSQYTLCFYPLFLTAPSVRQFVARITR
ncbi:MAG: HTTM domain-containing protein [Planctomycetes bacterium]|nr:HTTM domain-containing protein [Planctomycetota bacterium]